MIIGFSGSSSTGKTTVARHVGTLLNLPVRSCGEIVKSRAASLGISFKDLSDKEHAKIDCDTRKWGIRNEPCIIEGRYLDQVLFPIGTQVALVGFEASAADRRLRRIGSGSLTITEEDLDLPDSLFRARMYRDVEHIVPQLILNSSELSVEACSHRVIDFIQKVCLPPD